ncbi:dTMP kinase [Streptomyces sp. 900105755]
MSWLPPTRSLTALQRVLLVALLAPVALLWAVALLPAMLVLPFRLYGTERLVELITAHTSYAWALLTGSRPER